MEVSPLPKAIPPAQQNSGLYALVQSDPKALFHLSMLHSFNEAASKVEHQMIACDSHNDVGKQADIILQLMDKRVEGVAIFPATRPRTPAHQIRRLQEHGIPVVFCHYSVEGIRAPLLELPYREVGRRVGRILIERGHRRVAFIGGHWSESCAIYEAGLREVLQEAGSDLPKDLAHYGSFSFYFLNRTDQEKQIVDVLQRIVQHPDRPTAIMATFDSLAELVYVALEKMGLRMPEDISLMSFGDTWRESTIISRLTAVTMDAAVTARRAVELLEEMRLGKRPLDDDERFVLQLGLDEGRTLGPPPQLAQTPTNAT